MGTSDGTSAPIAPEVLLDVVQALGGLTSDQAAERDFALKVQKAYFEDLPVRFASDDRAAAYLREVLAAAASATRGFAAERTAFHAARVREEKLEELRGRVTNARFFHAPVEGEWGTKAYAIIVKLLGGAVGAATLMRFFESLTWWAVLAVAVGTLVWLFFGDLFFSLLTVRLQLSAYRRAGKTEDDVQRAWLRSVGSYKEVALQLLVLADRARQRWYPSAPGLLGPLVWPDSTQAPLQTFLTTPQAALADRTPVEVLSRLLDLHFGVRSPFKLYLDPVLGPPPAPPTQPSP